MGWTVTLICCMAPAGNDVDDDDRPGSYGQQQLLGLLVADICLAFPWTMRRAGCTRVAVPAEALVFGWSGSQFGHLRLENP